MSKTPVNVFLDEITRLDTFIRVALEGFGYSESAEEVTEVIRSITLQKGSRPHPVSNDEEYERRKAHARKLGEFAQAEASQGYSYLFSLAIVRLYSALEAAVDALFVASIRERPDVLNSEVFSKLKGPLVAFAIATEDERAEILRDRLFQETAARLRIGISRFEIVLDAIGLPGVIPDVIRRVILELAEIRHVIVHRNGMIDKKLVRRCPWLSDAVGTQIKVGGIEYHLYSLAATWYLVDLAFRWAAGEGVTPTPREIEVHKNTLATVEARYNDLRSADSDSLNQNT